MIIQFSAHVLIASIYRRYSAIQAFTSCSILVAPKLYGPKSLYMYWHLQIQERSVLVSSATKVSEQFHLSSPLYQWSSFAIHTQNSCISGVLSLYTHKIWERSCTRVGMTFKIARLALYKRPDVAICGNNPVCV